MQKFPVTWSLGLHRNRSESIPPLWGVFVTQKEEKLTMKKQNFVAALTIVALILVASADYIVW